MLRKLDAADPMLVGLLTVAAVLVCQVTALDNGLALTPPMGYAAWERYRCITDCVKFPDDCVSEKIYFDMADRLASDGWKERGYVHLNVDDCWMLNNRSSEGQLVPDPKRFPHGMRALADYIHSKGLKMGIYEDVGTNTCQGYPGSEGHYETDANTFASWNIDMLKFDCCHNDGTPNGFREMTAALNNTKRPMIYLAEWVNCFGIKPNLSSEVPKYCNMWRTGRDVQDSWSSVSSIIAFTVEHQDVLAAAQGPGAWNDPDMLVIGNFGLTHDQEQTHMAMWAIFAAPLMMSNNLRNIRDSSKQILQNKAIIAVDQDKMGKMGKRVRSETGIEVFVKAILPTGSFAVVVRNTEAGAPMPKVYSFTFGNIGIQGTCYQVTELFSNQNYGQMNSTTVFKAVVNPAGAIILTLKTCSQIPEGTFLKKNIVTVDKASKDFTSIN